MSGSGSYTYDEQTNDDIGEVTGFDKSHLLVMIVFSPLICVISACILVFIRFYIIDELISKYKQINFYCSRKYNIYIEEKKHPTPIKNNKLSTNFIKECNKSNINQPNTELDCSICLEQIIVEDYMKSKNELIFLSCSHVFHTSCIQVWTNTLINNGQNVNCPLCRDIIINIEDNSKYINYASDSSDSSDYSVASYWDY